MNYIPLVLTQNIDVALGGYYINFVGNNQDNYFDVGDGFIEAGFDNGQKGTWSYIDDSAIDLEAYDYSDKLSKIYIQPLGVAMYAYDTLVSPTPQAQITAWSNGDILFDSQRIQVNGQLALNGEYQVGDKTFTIINGIITAIV